MSQTELDKIGLRREHLSKISEYILPHKNKKSVVTIDGKKYERVLVKTHFVKPGETFEDFFNTYVLKNPEYKKTDIVGIGDKVTCIFQGRIMYNEDIKISWFAKTLSRFVGRRWGEDNIGLGNVYKMQLAIERVGLIRILFAAAMSAVTRPFGIHGVFYHITGKQTGQFDGFGGGSWYRDFGTLGPEKPNQLANEIYEKYGIKFFVPDANDFGCVILGKSSVIDWSDNLLCKILKDNPAGNFDEQTPLMFLREKK